MPKLIAGNGTLGISGMGGPATSAELSRPQELAKIGSTLYIVDSGANRLYANCPRVPVNTIECSVSSRVYVQRGLRATGLPNVYDLFIGAP